ncbi:MAG: hypothetical protein KAH34_06215 [Ketobacter sp.]|nr:hypothetical protein [Ketobacter sp.]
MKLLAGLIPLVLLLSGCDNNADLNNVPLQSPQWLLTGEDNPYVFTSTSLGLSYLPGGNAVYAYRSYDEQRQRRIGIWSVDPQGQTLLSTTYADPDLPAPGAGPEMAINTSKRLLALANDELLLIGFNGSFYHLDSSGALLSEYTWRDFGYQQLTLVAHSSERTCWVGRNDQDTVLLCATADGSVVWQVPQMLTFNSAGYPDLRATLQDDGTLVTAVLSEQALELAAYDAAGASLWGNTEALPALESRSLAAMISAQAQVVVGLRETAQDGAKSFSLLQFSTSGQLQASVDLPVTEPDGNGSALRLLPYGEAGYLVLTQRKRSDVFFGKNVADLQLISYSGVSQWQREISLDRFGADSGQLASLQIEVNNGVISALQNKQSVLVYTPGVIPVGVARMVDNLLLSQWDGDGQLLRENVIGRLRYMVDFEGGVYQVNEHGFYPLKMDTDGTTYWVAGSETKPAAEGPAVFASHQAFGAFLLAP